MIKHDLQSTEWEKKDKIGALEWQWRSRWRRRRRRPVKRSTLLCVRVIKKIIFVRKFFCRFFGDFIREMVFRLISYLLSPYELNSHKNHTKIKINRMTGEKKSKSWNQEKKSWNSSRVDRKSSKMCWIAIASASHLPNSDISRSVIEKRRPQNWSACLTHWTFHLIKKYLTHEKVRRQFIMNRWLPLTTFYISLCCLSFRRVSLGSLLERRAKLSDKAEPKKRKATQPKSPKPKTTKLFAKAAGKKLPNFSTFWTFFALAKIFEKISVIELFSRTRPQIFGDEAIAISKRRSSTNSAVIAVCEKKFPD